MSQKKYFHIPTKKTYHTNGASGLVSEDNDSPIPLWLAKNSQDWKVINTGADKKILYDLIKKNPDVQSRESLAKYVDNTEFIISMCGHFMTDINNDSIKFLIKPFNNH